MNRFLLATIIILTLFSATGCSSGAYSYDEAIKRGDIVYQVQVENFERFELFLNNLSIKKEDNIRITGFTHEGDPIFQDLEYDGKVIHYTRDNSFDEYAGEGKGVERDVCTKIIEKESEQGDIDYLLSGCTKGYDLFLINLDKDN
ncbi:hypothetical protein CD30_03770 [Ureibacillus massiliensis 4400831 = CIP 108448 = CCUG 49529]|uniref:DUF4362 domain-containing protein n=1 Tax=Ureibacillus massiliensis 4400831 = CIP 108448 = CCUG 49529 TaxID=1211035 RepID=A0A0A3J428_9BACL|nr:DUF4362 domain-containing protein [Ureibacillus massiliensis]KGR91706.1 hypothetical protein CD30_03770 [Ureibacillus massiliensis 4400831 = CIP 108448 = CCUG 49529]